MRSFAYSVLLLSLLVNNAVFAAEPSKSEAGKHEASSAPAKSDKPKDAAAEQKSEYEPDSLSQLNHEAVTAHREHKDDVAAHLMEKVVSGLEQEKVSDLSLAEALTNLGIIEKSAGKTKESDDAFARAKTIREKYHMPELETHLVDILPNVNFRKKGTEMTKETVEIMDGHDPEFPPDKLTDKSADAYSKLMASAHQHKRSGDVKNEFQDLRKALAIAHTMPKPNEKVLGAMNMLADTYRQIGRTYSAKMLFTECLAICDKLGKKDSAEYATLLDHTGQTLAALRQYDAAEKMMNQSIEIYKKALGPENPDIAITMCSLGELYIQQKQGEKGEKLLHDAIAMMKKSSLAADDMRIIMAEDYLSTYYAHHGKLKEAEDLQKELLAKMEKKFGKASPDLVLATNNLAQTLYREQKFSEADPLLKHCIELNQELYGPKHRRTLHAMGTYASFLEKTGHKDEADKILKQITAP